MAEIAGALLTTSGGSSRKPRYERYRVVRQAMDGHNREPPIAGCWQLVLRVCLGAARQTVLALGDAVCVSVVTWIGQKWLNKALR